MYNRNINVGMFKTALYNSEKLFLTKMLLKEYA